MKISSLRKWFNESRYALPLSIASTVIVVTGVVASVFGPPQPQTGYVNTDNAQQVKINSESVELNRTDELINGSEVATESNTVEVVADEPTANFSSNIPKDVKKEEVIRAPDITPPTVNANAGSAKIPSTSPNQVFENVPAQQKPVPASNNSNGQPSNTYVNSKGNTIQSPTHYNSKPAGASAKCKDGTYSFSQSRRGTCSGHGGVAIWY